MLEDHFYWILVYDSYFTHEGKAVLTKSGKLKFPFREHVPSNLLPAVVKYIIKPQLRRQANAAGIGRHTKEEVEKMGYQDLKAVSALLGNKPFMFGNEPTTLDCCVFAFISLILYVTMEESVYRKFLKNSFPNLKEHNKRIKEIYWKDWDSMCSHVRAIDV